MAIVEDLGAKAVENLISLLNRCGAMMNISRAKQYGYLLEWKVNCEIS